MSNLGTQNDPAHIVGLDRAHVWHHLTQHASFETAEPPIFVEGRGLRVWDIHGREFLDATSGGVWTVNVGYGRRSIADAVHAQLLTLNYFAGSAGSVPGSVFAARLLEKMPGMSRVYYGNSGSEANEKVFKMVRQIAAQRHGGRKWKSLYRERDYHGTTLGALSACGQPQRCAGYGPFVPGFVEVPHCLEYRSQFRDAADYGQASVDAIEAVIRREGPDTIGALCLEPITAGGGVITPPPGYWERIQDLCRTYEILLHIDEVVCGLGRTGTWFGYQNYGIRPDFVTMAKGVASGYAAIACTVTTEEIFEQFKSASANGMAYFRDISTFGGCLAGPAAALENMRIIEDEGLLHNTLLMGARLEANLHRMMERHPAIGEVRGKGLFWGIELVADRTTRTPLDEAIVQAVVAECRKAGILIGMTTRSLPSFNNTLCLSPALIVTAEEIDRICEGIDRALTACLG